MLVKIKVGDQTMEFDSQKVTMAILLDSSSKQAIKNMADEEQLILSGPPSIMRDNAAEAWQWAMQDWEGAKFVPGHVLGANGNVLNS